MDLACVGIIIGGLIGFFAGGFIGFIDTRSDLQDFANFSGREDVTDDEEEPKEPQPDYKAEADRLRNLLKTATDRADRLAAMNQGLTEDLAALKDYDPEEIEERLRKIREIRAEEERVERLRREVSAQIALSMLNSGGLNSGGLGFSASACCSLADQQRISWR